MRVTAYVHKHMLAGLLELVVQLPQALRPTHFGSHERAPVRTNLVSSTKFEAFRYRNSRGYFLFSPECLFNFTTSFVGDYGSLNVYPRNEMMNEASSQMLLEAIWPVTELSFACADEEYLSRNRYVAKFGASTVETWIGRDLTKYLPGVYWQTNLSKDLVERLSLLPMLAALQAAGFFVDERGDGVRIQLGARSTQWSGWQQTLEAELSKALGVFPRSEAIRCLKEATDIASLIEIASSWR